MALVSQINVMSFYQGSGPDSKAYVGEIAAEPAEPQSKPQGVERDEG